MQKLETDNLLFLRKEYPALYNKVASIGAEDDRVKPESAKSGAFNLLISIHEQVHPMYSKYDPELEASRWFQQIKAEVENTEHVLLFGFGLGYHFEQLLKHYPNKRYYLIEPDTGIFNESIKVKDLRECLQNNSIAIFALGSDSNAYANTINLLFNNIKNGFAFIVPPFYQRHYAYELKSLRSMTEQLRLAYQGDIKTRALFNMQWPENIINNYSAILNSAVLSDINCNYHNVPAIIVGSGPSLNYDLQTLKALKGKCMIIAAGTSIQALIAAGIEPDMAVSMDGGISNFKAYQNIDLSNTPLLYLSIIHKGIMEKTDLLPIFVRVDVDSIIEYLHPNAKSIPIFHSSFSVTGTAVQAAAYLGCNPILFAGQDLSYPGDSHYAEGVSHISENYLKSVVNDAKDAIENVTGGFNKTTGRMRNVLYDLEALIAYKFNDIDFINTSRLGAVIKGTRFKPLDEWANEHQHHFQNSHAHSLLQQLRTLQAERNTKQLRGHALDRLLKAENDIARLETALEELHLSCRSIEKREHNLGLQGLINKLVEQWNCISKMEIVDKVYMMMIKHHVMIVSRDLSTIGTEQNPVKQAEMLLGTLSKITAPMHEATPRLKDWIRQAKEKLLIELA